jgi:hemerythrin-like metal-binding protein
MTRPDEFLSWREEWDLGIPELDQQHRKLVARINRLAETHAHLRQEAGGPRAIESLLNGLLTEARAHFRAEETAMKEAGFPDLAGHHREHDMLLAELTRLIRDLAEDREEFGVGVLNALKSWFIAHVITEDREYARFHHSRHS